MTWVAGKKKRSMNIIKNSMNIINFQSCVTTTQIGGRTHAQEHAHFFFANCKKSDPPDP